MNENMDEVLWRGIEVFGNHDAAMNWLSAPCLELGGEFPIIMIGEAANVQTVLDVLERIESQIA